MILVDANVLVAVAIRDAAEHADAAAAIEALQRRGRRLVVSLQAIAETWVALTRPAVAAGARPNIGLSFEDARERLDWLLRQFPLLPDPPTLPQEWLRLLDQHRVIGVNAHDCRLAAFAAGHAIADVLTLNLKDFRRYAFLNAHVPAEILRANPGS